MRHRGVAAYFLAALVSGTLGSSAIVRAGWTRHAVSGCTGGSSTTGLTAGDRVYNFGAVPNTTACAVPDTEERPAHLTNGVGIWGFDASTKDKITLTVCSISPGAITTHCQEEPNPAPDHEIKHVNLFTSSDVWKIQPSHFKYILVELPGVDDGRVSRLHGFTTF